MGAKEVKVAQQEAAWLEDIYYHVAIDASPGLGMIQPSCRPGQRVLEVKGLTALSPLSEATREPLLEKSEAAAQWGPLQPPCWNSIPLLHHPSPKKVSVPLTRMFRFCP